MDARQQRTRGRLAATVIELASAAPIDEVTMSLLASRSGVHRSTLYEHTTSPVALLHETLRDELDSLRAELIDASPERSVEAIAHVTRGVLVHISSHAAIYSRGLGADGGTVGLHSLLSDHFEASIELLLDQHSVSVPFADGAEVSMAARFLADGIVGAITVWLGSGGGSGAADRSGDDREVDDFLAVLARLVPSWWPLSAS